MNPFDAVFTPVFDRLGLIGGILVALALSVPFGLYGERRKQDASGTGPGPSVTLTALYWISSIYYFVFFVFIYFPYIFRTVLGIWRSITAYLPSPQGILAGTSGIILSAIAAIAGVVLFFVVAGWAFRLGWRLKDRIR